MEDFKQHLTPLPYLQASKLVTSFLDAEIESPGAQRTLLLIQRIAARVRAFVLVPQVQ